MRELVPAIYRISNIRRGLLRFGGGQVIATLPHHFEIDEEGERCEARYKDQREPVLVAASRCGASSFHRRRPSARQACSLQCSRLLQGQHQKTNNHDFDRKSCTRISRRRKHRDRNSYHCRRERRRRSASTTVHAGIYMFEQLYVIISVLEICKEVNLLLLRFSDQRRGRSRCCDNVARSGRSR